MARSSGLTRMPSFKRTSELRKAASGIRRLVSAPAVMTAAPKSPLKSRTRTAIRDSSASRLDASTSAKFSSRGLRIRTSPSRNAERSCCTVLARSSSGTRTTGFIPAFEARAAAIYAFWLSVMPVMLICLSDGAAISSAILRNNGSFFAVSSMDNLVSEGLMHAP